MKDKDKILIIRMSALGDVAMSIPVIYSFASQYPETSITVLTRPFFAKLFINRPANINIKLINTNGEHKGFLGLMRIIRELYKEKFKHVADIHNVLRSWIITFALGLTGAKTATVDKQRANRYILVRKQNKDLRPQKSYIMRYIAVFERLGLPIRLNFTSLFAGNNSMPEMPSEIKDFLKNDTCVGIAPFARYATKALPLNIMEQVVSTLSSENLRIFLFGAKGDEQTILESWSNKYNNVFSIPSKASLEQELAIMGKMKVMLTMDSSNMHLASLVGTRVISIWGSTTPHCGFLGYNQNWDDCIITGHTCQPCSIAGNATCPNGTLQCLKNIESNKIVNQIHSVLNNAK